LCIVRTTKPAIDGKGFVTVGFAKRRRAAVASVRIARPLSDPRSKWLFDLGRLLLVLSEEQVEFTIVGGVAAAPPKELVSHEELGTSAQPTNGRMKFRRFFGLVPASQARSTHAPHFRTTRRTSACSRP